ncbi:MAG: RHS repeat-associated core domain-containing protein, partial [Ketobacter sp.]|nr:RHS repeat-associated core domain-containing protein [Ketobacter sp.]
PSSFNPALLPNFQTASAGDVVTTTYTYDSLYRLTGAASQSPNLPISNYQYTYDSTGNRLTYALNGTQVATYTYDAADRLTEISNQSSVISYQYDANGNLLNDGQYSYSYDSANRLSQLNDGISNVAYTYNGDGVRVAQVADGIRTDYVQDVALPLPQLLTAEQGGTVNRYLRGLGLIGQQQAGSGLHSTGSGQALAGDPVWQYHLPDALGSVRQVTNPAGQVTLAQRFDPFGGLETQHGTGNTAYGFTGEEQDDSGHIFLRARTYNPETGRFLQSDSVIGSPTQPRTLHRYAYGFSNPVNYTDPSGHMPPQAMSLYRNNNRNGPAGPRQVATGFNPLISGNSYRSVNGGGIRTVKGVYRTNG